LYTLIFSFFYMRLEDTRFWTEFDLFPSSPSIWMLPPLQTIH